MIAKTISGAADLLNVSQPGISRTLKHMESKLGVALFERRQSGMIPTPEAQRLYDEIEPLYGRLEDLDANLKRVLYYDDPTIQIGCAPSFSHYILPTLLSRAKAKMPKIIARVDTMSNEQMDDYIVSLKGEFALSTYDPDHPMILAEPSFAGKIRCVVPVGHPLARNKSVSFKEIAEYDQVGYYNDTYIGQLINSKFRELDLEMKISVKVRFNGNACIMAARGLGVGFAVDYATMDWMHGQIKSLPIEDDLAPLQTYILRHKYSSFSDTVRKFYTNLVSDMSELGQKL